MVINEKLYIFEKLETLKYQYSINVIGKTTVICQTSH